MFIYQIAESNRYLRRYMRIIQSAPRTRPNPCHHERHHIVPRSMGGTDHPDNLVYLTYREHFVCHVLLTRFVVKEHRRSAHFAVSCFRMDNSGKRKLTFTSRDYAQLRESARIAATLNTGHTWVNNGTKQTKTKYPERYLSRGWECGRLESSGYTRNDQIREHMRQVHLGREITWAHKLRDHMTKQVQDGWKPPWTGKKRQLINCSCGKSISAPMKARWHKDCD